MKKLFVLFLSISILFCGCTAPVENTSNISNSDDIFVKSVWITYYELEQILKGKNENDFTLQFDDLLLYLKDLGFNTITVQCRAFSDAFYKSNYYPSSNYFVSNQGDSIPFDPLKIICDLAIKNNIYVEAWINPYRVSNKTDFTKLADTNPAKQWRDTSNVLVTKSGIYYNPASPDVTNLIVNGVVEIINNYNISAIHFDDYFYPSDVDDLDNEDYIKANTDLTLSQWRRQNVTNMIKEVRKAINSFSKDIKLGVSPCANIGENMNTLFADVIEWSSDDKLLDYICPQIYYGFKNETMPFMFITKKWQEISNIDLYVGLPLYKFGNEDKYAGVGKKEFLADDVINRQIEYLSKIDSVKGIYVFSYSSLIGNEKQVSKIKEI